jgi:hypothetical protein
MLSSLIYQATLYVTYFYIFYMRKLRVFVLIIPFMGLISCSEKEKSFELIGSEVVIESIMARMPGDLMIKDSLALMIDPFSKDKLLQIFNLKNGSYIDSYINKGNGPNEFITPSLDQINGDVAIIHDINLNKLAYFDLKSMNDSLVKIEALPCEEAPSKVFQYKENHFIGAFYGNKNPFKIFNNKQTLGDFGRYPVEGEVNNAAIALQGKLQFDSKRQLLAYSINKIGYVSLYKIYDDKLNNLWENTYVKPRYNIEDGNLKWNEKQLRGPIEMAITKDYVACLVCDDADQSYRFKNEESAPGELIIFNISDGKINRKLKLDSKAIRICSESNSNDLYSISIDGDFKIKKYILD